MEYFELGDFQSYLRNSKLCPNKRLPEDQVKDITSQLVDALSLMHGQKFAHRDIKPANILIKRQHPDQWWIKLCDLGLSKRVEDTASTVIRGTPGFMPPELLGFSGEPRTDSCLGDMWCLGELAYQALTGRATFETFADLGKYCAGLIQFPDQPLRDIEVSEEAIGFIVALMEVKPVERLSAQSARTHAWMDTASESQPVEDLHESLGQSEWSLDVPFTPLTGGTPAASAEWTATVTNARVASTVTVAAETGSTHKPAQTSTLSISSESLTNLPDFDWTTEMPFVAENSESKPTIDVVASSQPDYRNIHSAVDTMSPEERRLYVRLFREADTADLGVITGEAAVKFFKNTKLPALILGEIWQISDVENRGFLIPRGFSIALRLIGHAQAGREPTVNLAFQPGPYPRFDNSSSPLLSILEA